MDPSKELIRYIALFGFDNILNYLVIVKDTIIGGYLVPIQLNN
jgi:hypothetical protein